MLAYEKPAAESGLENGVKHPKWPFSSFSAVCLVRLGIEIRDSAKQTIMNHLTSELPAIAYNSSSPNLCPSRKHDILCVCRHIPALAFDLDNTAHRYAEAYRLSSSQNRKS
jgi:hypothetical protein